MARQPRLIVPDVPLHIVQRGNDRMSCFRIEQDYLVYIALLRKLSAAQESAVHAYCLMTNHIHLLLTPSSIGACSALMHGLAQRYAQYFNRRHERTGTLWEGRFRSCLVQSSSYVLACCRYIEMNPVRAGMVAHPSMYPWSSYAENSGAGRKTLIKQHSEVVALGAAGYAMMMGDALPEEFVRKIREATNGGYPLASEPYLLSLGGATTRRLRPGRAGRPRLKEKGMPKESAPDPDLFSGGAAS